MEIKKAEETIRMQAQILDQIHEAIITTDLDGYVISWNKGAEQMYSYTSDEALGRHISFIYPEDTRGVLQELVIGPLKEKGRHETEVQLMRKSSEKFYALLLLTLLKDNHGAVTGMLGSSVDISGRKQAQERLAESEERFRSAFDNAAIGMALVGTDGRFLKVNPALCRIVGYSQEELINLTFQEITFPADLDADLQLAKQLFAGEVPSYRMEKRYIHKDGRIIWILLSRSVVRDSSGKIIYAIAQIEDITEKKNAEVLLRETEEKFRLFLEYCPVHVFFKDENIRSVHLSRNFEKMLGRPLNELLGKTMDELFPSELAGSMVEDDLRTLREGRPLEVEEEFNGRIYSTLKFPIFIEKKPRFLAGFTVDITERKQLEEKLRRQIERYDLVADGVRDGIWDWDVMNKRVFFSSQWKTMRGYSEEEVVGSEEEWSSGIHPEDAARVFARVQAHFEGKTPWFSEEYRVRRKDGSWMWVHDRGLALKDAAGRVIRMAGSETDITHRKYMEEEREKLVVELQEALAKIKTLSGLLPICMHCKKIRDDKGYWNQLELFIIAHSEAEFSHGICPDCLKQYYPEFYNKTKGLGGKDGPDNSKG